MLLQSRLYCAATAHDGNNKSRINFSKILANTKHETHMKEMIGVAKKPCAWLLLTSSFALFIAGDHPIEHHTRGDELLAPQPRAAQIATCFVVTWFSRKYRNLKCMNRHKLYKYVSKHYLMEQRTSTPCVIRHHAFFDACWRSRFNICGKRRATCASRKRLCDHVVCQRW